MKIKRILSATLAAAMLLCCCILTAFAESETYMGSLNGYSYVCSASCRSDEAKANMSSRSSETLIISGPLKYVSTDGKSKVFKFGQIAQNPFSLLILALSSISCP